MTPAEAVKALQVIADYPDDLDHGPGSNHAEADAILLDSVSAEVRSAYEALIESQRWWAFS